MKTITKKAVLVLCTAVLFALPLNAFAYAGEDIGANISKSCQQNFDLQKVKDCIGEIPNFNIPCFEKPCNGNPCINKPCNNKPEVDKPEVDKPEVGKPEVGKPEVGKPDTDKPGTDKPDTDKPGTDGGASMLQAYEQKVVQLVNIERSKAGLSPLKANQKLSNVAESKAEDMRDKNYFSHTSPTYGSPFDMMKKFGINYKSAGENIAKGQKNPESVMNGWMNSSGHKANILNVNYTEIGVGYVTDSKGISYWVQMFIKP